MAIRIISLILVSLLMGCLHESEDNALNLDNNGNPQPNNNAGATIESKFVKAGIVGVSEATEVAENISGFCVAGVYSASVLATGGQQLVTTGTLTQTTSGQMNFTYLASPSDKLKMVFVNGKEVECIITAMDGNFSGDDIETFVDRFFSSDRILELQIFSQDQLNASLNTRLINGQIQDSLQGDVTLDGTSYNINLTNQGTESWDPDSAELIRDENITGTISSDNFSLTVNETNFFKSIFFDNLVINRNRTINNFWTVGNDQYSLQNVQMRTSEVNGRASEISDFWIISGALLKNGSIIGEVKTKQDPVKIDVIIETATESILLADFEI